MEYKQVVKEFESFKNTPKVKLNRTPNKFEYIIQLFMAKEEIKGGLILNDSLLEKREKKHIIQPFPIAVILKSSEGNKYEEGEFVYLTDDILQTFPNDAWFSWREKFENQKPTPHEVEPPRYIGGLNLLEQFRVKKDSLRVGYEDEDDGLYQIPERIIKGLYNV